ncbi:zinc finger protein 638 [Pelodytes ibericus]
MFNPRGSFPGQGPRQIVHTRMNQPGMNHPGMNVPNMGLSGMNQPGMGLPAMNRPGLNNPGMNHPGIGHPGINHPSMGLPNMNQPGMNLNRMNHPGMNQGGIGFHPEMRNPGMGLRSHAMEPQVSFGGGNPEPIGRTNMPVRPLMHATPERGLGPQAFQKRFVGSCPAPRPVQPRMQAQNQGHSSSMNKMAAQPTSDMMGVGTLQESSHMGKENPWEPQSSFGNLSQDLKSVSSQQSERLPNPQNRCSSESASSILESFGLSNEDLEELSRYPDDQLTPGNMPVILRDIRLRKMGRPGSTPDQGGGIRSGGDVVKSKVIDYGHSSKYPIGEDPVRPYNSRRTDNKDLKPGQAKAKVEPKKTVAKEPPDSANLKSQKPSDESMENKIPTISFTRKSQPVWPKTDRSNNKTVFGEQQNIQTADNSVNVSNSEQSAVNIIVQPEVPAMVNLPDVQPGVQVGTLVSQVNYPAPSDASPVDTSTKGQWQTPSTQTEAQKKRNPTPSMMNDYYAASPKIFPHICSLCNIECRHLKDWIRHQNNASHIESCRQLRIQYPYWNPQELSSLRNEDKKSDDASSNRSKSHSSSPKRSRSSGSRYRARRSRSRSPRHSGRLRSRSRSPRRPRHSPRRSRSPRRRSRSPRRSLSPRRPRRARSSRTRSNSPDKRAVDAAVHDFIEATKQKSVGDKTKLPKTSSNGRNASPKSPSSSAKTKKPTGSTTPVKKPSTSSSTVKRPSSTSSAGSSKKSSSTPRKPSISSNTEKKAPATSSSAKKPVTSSSSAKSSSSSSSSSKKPLHSSSSAKKPPPAEAFNPVNKFTSKTNSGTIIHITNLPDTGYTDQDILKIMQQFGKVSDILIVRSKNEAYLETNFKEAALAAVAFSESVPLMISNKRITLRLAGQKEPEKITAEKKSRKPAPPVPVASVPVAPVPDPPVPVAREAVKVVPPGYIKCYKLCEPKLKDTAKCVILISNLPEAQSNVDEITNLAKPFGGVADILFFPTHRKAYLELTSKNSLDSMIKFYEVFPPCVSGNILTITMNSKYKNVKDEDRVFAEIIEQSLYQITPTIFEKFVHLSNLPEKGYTEFEIVCIGLRFGKVEHYVIIANKRKAILHMATAQSAKAMHSFLCQFPCSVGDSILTCALSSKTSLEEDEYITTVEKEQQSSEPEITMDETETAQTADEETAKHRPKPQKPVEAEPSMTPSPISSNDGSCGESSLTEPLDPPIESGHKEPARQDISGSAHTNNKEKPPIFIRNLPVFGAQVVSDDDDDDEEAAEAPETPDCAPPVFIHAEPMETMAESDSFVQPPLFSSEELEVLVSVESEEEEEEEQEEVTYLASSYVKRLEPMPSQTCVMDDLAASEMEGIPVDVEPYLDPQTLTEELVESSIEHKEPAEVETSEVSGEPSVPEQPNQEQKPEEVCDEKQPDVETSKPGESEISTVSDTKSVTSPTVEDPSITSMTEDSDGKATNGEPPTPSVISEVTSEKETKTESDSVTCPIEKNKESLPSKTSEGSTKEPVDITSTLVSRTAKYNPQKGEISVTVTVDPPKPFSKVDTRKKSLTERRSTGRESSTPKSNSSRSSPSESPTNNPKSSAGSSQKKGNGKSLSSQQDKESKVVPKPWERETRLTTRKDDRSKAFSTRYTRSSKGSTRGPKSKEDENDDQFPFDLEEFVTVDEIVEDQTQANQAAHQEKTPQDASANRKGKRKEEPSPSQEAKKFKGRITVTCTSQDQSFVTLDEIGGEDETTPGTESSLGQEPQALLTVDEVHADEDQPSFVKVSQELMTLDEVSDEEDVTQDSASGIVSAEIQQDLSKGPLLVTLDEVSGEEEDQSSKGGSLSSKDQSLTDVQAKAEKKSSSPKAEKKSSSPKAEKKSSSPKAEKKSSSPKAEKKSSSPKAEKKSSSPKAEKKSSSPKAEEVAPKAGEDHPTIDPTEQPLLTLDEVKGDDDTESIADIGFDEVHQFFTVDEVGEEEEDSQVISETVRKATEQVEEKPDVKSETSEPTPRRGRPRKRPLPEPSTPVQEEAKAKESPQKPSETKEPKKSTPQQNEKRLRGTPTPQKPTPTAETNLKSPETPAKKKKAEHPSTETAKLAPFNPSVPIGMEYLVPKTGYFCELCSLFYMDEPSKLKHCKSLRHYQSVEKHIAKKSESDEKTSSPDK